MLTRPVIPLTADEQTLAARWFPLARKVAARHGVDVGVALESLCKAARGFEPAKGWTFQAWATRILTNAAIDELRKERHVELLPFEESLHAASAEHADILGERDSLPEPVKAWTPPPDLPERKPQPPETSRRSVQRRARAEGTARLVGRPGALDARALYRVLGQRPEASTAELARSLGLHCNVFCPPKTLILSYLATLGDAGAAASVTIAILPTNLGSLLSVLGVHQAETLQLARSWRSDDLGPDVAPDLMPEVPRRVVKRIAADWAEKKCQNLEARPRLLVSFADPAMGHDGNLYTGAGAVPLGGKSKLLFAWPLSEDLRAPLRSYAARARLGPGRSWHRPPPPTSACLCSRRPHADRVAIRSQIYRSNPNP